MAEEETTTQKGEKIMDRVFNNRIPEKCGFCNGKIVARLKGVYYSCTKEGVYIDCNKYYASTTISWLADYRGL